MFWNSYLNFGYNPFQPNMFGFSMPYFMPNFNFFQPIMSPYFSVFNFWNTPSLSTAYNDNQNYTNPYFSNNNGFDTFERTILANTVTQPQTLSTTTQYAQQVEPVKTPEKTTLSVTTNSDGSITIDGYNAQAGQKLADIALKNADSFHNHCAGHVETDIEEAGLGQRTDVDAYQMFNTMDNNPNFKPLETTNVDVSKLPAGCVPVYDKGVSGYSSDYGHVEITLGDGRAASDGITNNMRQNPTAIYAPVYT